MPWPTTTMRVLSAGLRCADSIAPARSPARSVRAQVVLTQDGTKFDRHEQRVGLSVLLAKSTHTSQELIPTFAICETYTRNAGLSPTHDTPRNEKSPSAESASSHVFKRRPRVRSRLSSQVHQVRKTTRSKPSRTRSPCFTRGPAFADASGFVSLEGEVGRHHRQPPVLSIGERAPRATNGNSGVFRDEPDLDRNTRSPCCEAHLRRASPNQQGQRHLA